MSSGELGAKRILRRRSAGLSVTELSVRKTDAALSLETSINIYRATRLQLLTGE